jgi:hypothetical protein
LLIRVLAVSGLADLSVRGGKIANGRNTDDTDYTEPTRISGVCVQGSCWSTIKAVAYPCGFRIIRVIRVLAVSWLADSSVLGGEIANRQNTEATDYTETTRISGERAQGRCLSTIKAFAYPCGFRPSV